ncbi:CBS domain-containing protein [Candidatus Bathyarchaeota archaeon]|nr:CBS domain-containing protein [Candidatus Bathyarchaeota archaeon]
MILIEGDNEGLKKEKLLTLMMKNTNGTQSRKFSLPTPPDMKELRVARGFTQSHLADLCGFSQSLIARIENGSVNPRLETVRDILDMLYGESNIPSEALAKDIMTRSIISIRVDQPVKAAIELLHDHGISQLPVLDENNDVVGAITEKKMVEFLSRNGSRGTSIPVKNIHGIPFPTIAGDAPIHQVEMLLKRNPAIVVKEDDQLVGIITKSNLLSLYE